ncbi:hypothetical protein QYE76_026180 [Lolium multiflorum]|uniref:Gag-pol polyprotein n=1 Tax=Lolium multiflorum TaxID=4521 RepID=A0AAD8RFD5_LOLMU|nr:hypothetical protein QYE76_026180 [Lolium multiflorum]
MTLAGQDPVPAGNRPPGPVCRVWTAPASCSVELWEIILHGYREPQDPTRLTSTEFYNRQLNASARDKIRSGINRKLLDQVDDIVSAKELWDRIVVLQEGTDLIQSSLYETAKQEAYQFMIRDGESVFDAYARLGALKVRIKGLGGEKYNDGFEMNEAFIKSKVIAMIAVKQEDTNIGLHLQIMTKSADLNSDDLVSYVAANENMAKAGKRLKAMNRVDEASHNHEASHNLALKARADHGGEEAYEIEEDEEMTSTSDIATDFAFFAKKYKGKLPMLLNDKKKKRTCYNCDEESHFANECPYEKRVDKPKFIKGVKPRLKPNPINDRYKKNKGRAFVGAEYLSDEEDEDEEKEGVADKVKDLETIERAQLLTQELNASKEELEVAHASLTRDLDHLERANKLVKDELKKLGKNHDLLQESYSKALESMNDSIVDKNIASSSTTFTSEHAKLVAEHVRLQEELSLHVETNTYLESLVTKYGLNYHPNESSCEQASILEENVRLTKELAKFTTAKNKMGLDDLLSKQRSNNQKFGLGYVPKSHKKKNYNKEKPAQDKNKKVTNRGKATSGDRTGPNDHYALFVDYYGDVYANYVGPRNGYAYRGYSIWGYSSGGPKWVFDSGCTNHMTGGKGVLDQFIEDINKRSSITFGDNSKGKVLGYGKVAISKDLCLETVMLVEHLGYNLLSIYHLADAGYNSYFTKYYVQVFRSDNLKLVLVGYVENNLYVVDLSKESPSFSTCLMAAKHDEGWLWHRRLGHVNMRNLKQLLKGEHIVGLTGVTFEKDRVCSACVAGKQLKKKHPIKSIVTTSRPLELLHLDLFGPSHYDTLGGSKYGLVIVDDYSRYSWVFLLKSKDETHREFITFAKKAQRTYESEIKAIRTDNGTEFKNYTMQEFVDDEGIKHEFSAPYTPQQNGVVERKNRTIIEMARTMLSEFNSPHNFWGEAISTAVHYSNRLFLRPSTTKLHMSFSQNNKGKLGKFETRTIEGIFVGYAENSHAYRYYNRSTGTIEVSCDVVFLEDNGSQVEQVVPCVAGNDDDPSSAIKHMGIGHIRPMEVHSDDQGDGIEVSSSPQVEPSSTQDEPSSATQDVSSTQDEPHPEEQEESPQPTEQDHDDGQETSSTHDQAQVVPHDQVLARDEFIDHEGTIRKIKAATRASDMKVDLVLGSISKGVVHEALVDPDWVIAMQEELECFTRNEVWSLVERPKDHRINVIGTKWVFKNKQDEDGIVIRNKASTTRSTARSTGQPGPAHRPVNRMSDRRARSVVRSDRSLRRLAQLFRMISSKHLNIGYAFGFLIYADDMYTYLIALLALYCLFTGDWSGEDRDTTAKRGRLAGHPPRRTSGRTSQLTGGSSARGRTKTSANKRKDKHAAQDTDEVLPEFNVGDVHIGAWRRLRESNPYRFEAPTYTGGDQLFWTDTQKVMWDEYYDSREHMKKGTIVMPKAIKDVIGIFGVCWRECFWLQDLFSAEVPQRGLLLFAPSSHLPTISGMYYSYLLLAKLFRETLISKSGDTSECRAYHLNLMYYCNPEHRKLIDGCDLIYCELRRCVRERLTPNLAQYVQLLINHVVPAPLNTQGERVRMEAFKVPAQGDRPDVLEMMPSERRSKASHDHASSSSSRRPQRGASRFFSSLWQMCKNTNDVAHQSLSLNQETRRRQNEFMASRNAPVPPPGAELEPVHAPNWEMPLLSDEMFQNFDPSLYFGAPPPRPARAPHAEDEDEDEEDDGDEDDNGEDEDEEDDDEDGDGSSPSAGHEFY